ncbi:Receptor-like serine/threonine-protein kinase [Heracleum sosnowskyi]|uniref:Receptor-like serine/threonine-protein kinase n=1 Tax=Heracleum sosnowskyi TaxID=360622 RepID=A0AAD8JKH2_9APIA|nr:Receptor-like serine/threonine-protein kinase [Heracleum sosnowskyi]
MHFQEKLCFLILHIYILCFFISTCTTFGADTISANQSISGNQTIVSSGENFRLGFFKPGKSSKYYVGIWYNKVSTQTVAWIANREKHVSDKYSSQLKIENGNLVLVDESKNVVWSTNVSSSSSGLDAVLLDDGNLVLRDGKKSELWGSINDPSHTWLPGGKIAYDNRTKEKQLLTSWKNKDDPSPGLFSLELDPVENQYVIKWNKSIQYWISGSWNGQIFSLVPEMRANYIYNFSYVRNVNESYFTYNLYDNTIISRFIMDYSGQVKQLTWLESTKQWNLFWSQPRQQCEVYAYCGAYGACQNSLPFCNCLPGFEQMSKDDWDLNDYSGGCKRKIKLNCGNASTTGGKKDKFLTQTSMRWTSTTSNSELPANAKPQTVAAGSTKECESTCLSNCSCTAYTFDSGKCLIWTRDLMNLQQISADDNNGKVVYIRLSSLAPEVSNGKNNKGVVIGAVVGAVIVIILVGLVLFVLIRRRRLSGTSKAEGALMAYVYRDLQNATKNFSEKLGGGGFGSVFKGTLPDSSVIAVKKLEGISQGEKQFRTEVSTIGTIQHVNLVRLRGFCSEGNKKLLVYDYMPNGSLDSHIFSDKRDKVMDWKTRYQIALGTARGLVYLHEKCRECIIHCDIKPENILLDAELCPKVADFGLAKLVGHDFSRVLTTMRGTRGYLAPEWLSGVAVTAKADVYSYGMMVFEFVSGRRNTEQCADGKVTFFPSWAAGVTIDGGDILSLLDPKLDRNADVEEVTKLCRVACWCIQDDESIRPSMSQIVQILEGISDVNLPPNPRNLQVFVDNQEDVVFFTESSSNQSSQTKSMNSNASSQTKAVSAESSNV